MSVVTAIQSPAIESSTTFTRYSTEPRFTRKTQPTSEIVSITNSKENRPAMHATNLFDAAFRATIRSVEPFIGNEALRVTWRGLTEVARKTSELAMLKLSSGVSMPSIKTADLVKALSHAAENTAGSAIIEPAFHRGYMKIIAGAGNMAARFASRLSFFAASRGKVVSKENLHIGFIPQELWSRSLYRAIPEAFTAVSELVSPKLGFAFSVVGRFVEQFAINTDMSMARVFDRALQKIGITTHRPNEVYNEIV